MSEKRTNPLRKINTHHPAAGPLPLDDAQVDLFAGNSPPTDDSPTVISKNQPKPASGELLTSSLHGRVLAHFELLEPIGVGGMAAVLRARDKQLDRIVALKILPPDMAKDQENVKRFHQEARSAAKLDHENIARVFFYGEDQGLHFIAFEFVEGDNLRTILERRGRLPVAEAVQDVLQMAAGLAHASHRGVVHRDIKPSNIIVTPTGRAKLVDMGLARSLEPHKDLQLTQSGVTLGTFDYISPEQALEPREADVRSDIYSLGCTFYHMLTGEPPVPEGTAAKKLNHHQHIKPTDPRQLVPDLPDHVVMVLDRMMAKQAKDRYQTPEELVHDLFVAAHKLGSSLEVPEGVLSVEAAVPSPASRRPVLMAAVAVAAVIGLVLLLLPPSNSIQSTPDQGPTSPAVVKAAVNAPRPKVLDDPPKISPGNIDPAPVVPPAAGADTPAELASVTFDSEDPTPQSLAEWADTYRDNKELVIELKRDLLLKIKDADPGLRFKAAEKIVLRGKDPAHRPTIRLIYDGAERRTTPWAALTFESKRCDVENVRILLVGVFAEKVNLIGLRFLNGVQHTVTGCEFIQAQPGPEENSRLVSIMVENNSSTLQPKLDIARCCFLGYRDLKPASAVGPTLELTHLEGGGQDAVVRRGAANIEAVDCAFSPHAAAFRLEQTTPTPPNLALRHCTVALGGRSAVVHLADQASGKIEASQCLFGAANEAAGTGSTLIRQTVLRDLGDGVSFAGQDNRYFNVSTYWPDVADHADSWFQRFDKSSSLLENSPWQSEGPQTTLNNLRLAFQGDPAHPRLDDSALRQEEEKRVQDGFRVKRQSRELRPADGIENPAEHLIGVERLLDFSYLKNMPALEENPEVVSRKVLIVNPDMPADSNKGRYQRLDQAMLDANKSGADILIRKNGRLVLEQPIRLGLEKAENEVTIKADQGYRPIVTLAEPLESGPALFTLYDGKLNLKDLEFRLSPANRPYQSQSVVAFVGGGQCTLKDCQITLDRNGTEVGLAVASLRDPGKEMMKLENRACILELENCLVRGDGDLMLSRASRPFELRVRNTLAVLGGSVLNLEPEPEGSPVAQASHATLALERSTTYLGGPLIRLQAGKDLKSLLPVVCRPAECLFVSAAGKSLIQFEAGEAQVLKNKLTWMAGNNAYGNFMDMVTFPPARGEETAAAPPLNKPQWQEFSLETGSPFKTIKFNGGTVPVEGAYLGALPAQFKVPDLPGLGADIAKLRLPAADK